MWITNAYFAPVHSLLRKLARTACRGVDVRFLLSGKSDQPVVRSAGRSYYRTLPESGVRIFEYQPAVLHAKTRDGDGTGVSERSHKGGSPETSDPS